MDAPKGEHRMIYAVGSLVFMAVLIYGFAKLIPPMISAERAFQVLLAPFIVATVPFVLGMASEQAGVAPPTRLIGIATAVVPWVGGLAVMFLTALGGWGALLYGARDLLFRKKAVLD